MRNPRRIDHRTFLSGGFQNIPADIEDLTQRNILGALIICDTNGSLSKDKASLAIPLGNAGIRLGATLLHPFNEHDEYPTANDSYFGHANEVLTSWDSKFPASSAVIIVSAFDAGAYAAPAIFVNYLCGVLKMSLEQAFKYLADHEEYIVDEPTVFPPWLIDQLRYRYDLKLRADIQKAMQTKATYSYSKKLFSNTSWTFNISTSDSTIR